MLSLSLDVIKMSDEITIIRLDMRYNLMKYHQPAVTTMGEWELWNEKQSLLPVDYLYINAETDEIITDKDIIAKFEAVFGK